MPTNTVPVDVKVTIDRRELHRYVDEKIRNGEITINIREGYPVAFTVDKTKHRVRFSDETEESVKVWVEPKESE